MLCLNCKYVETEKAVKCSLESKYVMLQNWNEYNLLVQQLCIV